MSQLRAHAALLLIAATLAALAGLLMPTPASAATTHTKTEITLLKLALGSSADYDSDTAAAVLTTADQVCEGLISGVPVTTIETHVAAAGGLTLARAHRFVGVAAIRCRA